MPKAKVFLSLVVIVMAVTLVGGATMAWFTAATDPIDNVFTAGTVEIDAGDKTSFPNWNPGDDDEAKFCVTNTGSKKVNIRLNFEDAGWNPGPLRILVLYKANDIQLIGVEWPTFCKGCTGTSGPLAIASATYSYSASGSPKKLNNNYYFGTTFSDIQPGTDRDPGDVARWLESGTLYHGWCLDNQVTISPGTFDDVEIFDPFCNPNWVSDTNATDALKTRWENIDFDKISYIINHDFLNRGYISTEIQQAIWNYTNSSYNNDYYKGNVQDIVNFVDSIAVNYNGDIVEALNDNNNVIWSMLSWEIKDENGAPVASGNNPDDWVIGGDYIYFVNRDLEPGQTLCIYLKVKLDGTKTGNIYQGVNYVFRGFFEAVQSSNYAPYHEWNVDYYGTPAP